jgi:leader peptidase (prepilin peptidase)/N-methyltransferase
VQADLVGKAHTCARPTLSGGFWAFVAARAPIAALAAVGAVGGLLPVLATWAGGLCALGFVDAKKMLVPRPLARTVASVTASGLVAVGLVRGDWEAPVSGFVVAGLAVAVYGSVALKFPAKLGFGDVRVAGLVGLGLGAISPEAAVTALAVAPLLGGLLARCRRGQPGAPLGAFLAVAAVVGAVGAGAPVFGRGALVAR